MRKYLYRQEELECMTLTHKRDGYRQKIATFEMSLSLALLSFLLVNTSAQIQECRLTSSLQKVYENFMRDANPELIWNVAMSNQALEELNVKGSVMRPNAPYIAINATRAFDKSDKNSLEKKVRLTLGRLVRHYRTINELSAGVNFGCNGVYTTKEQGDVLTVLCFFQNY